MHLKVGTPSFVRCEDATVDELLVKVGDAIKTDQSLITVESDKASMEIPTSRAWRGPRDQG